MAEDSRVPADHDPERTAVLPEETLEAGASADRRLAIAEAEARAEEQRNLYLRAVAELDNFRKRSQRDVEQAHKYGLERFAQDLLGVVDSLEAGIASAETSSDRSLIDGQQATLKLLLSAIQKHGIRAVEPAGERFNPELHEAIAMQEAAGAEPDTVLKVVQKGYQLNGRLLRPARVIVARGP
ncbi:MAG TPA: nucleotide exchange factor GrpE [Steroidobacteraceae bacterium]|nr:nucleotide exchange factor GrpE [Steroidobacteraceae bacterium]